MARSGHSDKDIQAALFFTGIRTPRNTGNHVKQIRRVVDNGTTKDSEG
jgi:hypothetical protein